jgi:chaperone BCS1
VTKKDDASSTVRTDERIEMTVEVEDGVPMLLRLLGKARKEHMDTSNLVEWKQKLWRMTVTSVTGDANIRIKFNPALTHSTKSFDTIVLDADVKADLVGDVAAFLAGEAWYATMGLSYKRGYLLHGPPGTGKSSIVLAISSMAKADIYSLNLSVLKNDLDLDYVFASLPERCVVVFEDVDCMGSVVKARTGKARAGKAASPTKKDDDADAGGSLSTKMMIAKMVCSASTSFEDSGITLSCLLNHLDGAGSNHGRIFVMTTNHPEQLDPALIRPGRTDVQLRLGMCSRQQIGTFFELFYPGVSPPRELLEIPGDVLSPAEVSSTMLQFRRDPGRAVEKLGLIARKDSANPYRFV